MKNITKFALAALLTTVAVSGVEAAGKYAALAKGLNDGTIAPPKATTYVPPKLGAYVPPVGNPPVDDLDKVLGAKLVKDLTGGADTYLKKADAQALVNAAILVETQKVDGAPALEADGSAFQNLATPNVAKDKVFTDVVQPLMLDVVTKTRMAFWETASAVSNVSPVLDAVRGAFAHAQTDAELTAAIGYIDGILAAHNACGFGKPIIDALKSVAGEAADVAVDTVSKINNIQRLLGADNDHIEMTSDAGQNWQNAATFLEIIEANASTALGIPLR